MGTESEPEPSAGAGSGELTLAVTDSGVLVTGEPSDVTAYVERLRRHDSFPVKPTVSNVADAVAGASALAALSASSGQYVQLSQRSIDLLRAHGAIPGQTPGTFYGFVRNASGFAGNLEFTEVSLAASQAAALQLAAATVALKVAIANVERAVERVEGKLDGLVTLANAKVLGEVITHHALLCELTDTIDRTGYLPVTDWQTVAHLGVAVPAAIEQLRQTAMLRIGELDGSAEAGERARKLREIVESGQLRRTLELLPVAEDAYYRWQRVRLEQARRADPEHLQDMAERATAQLAQDMLADRDLIDLLDTKLVEYAGVRPLERLHPFVTKHLAADAEELHDCLVAFAETRRAQVHDWQPLARPSWGEAAQEARARAIDAGRQAAAAGSEARRAVESGARSVGQQVGSWTGDRREALAKRLGRR